jgi:hypothetical protein
VDTHDNLQAYYMNNGMTDFLPVVLPTEEKVEAMRFSGQGHLNSISDLTCPRYPIGS